MRSIAKLLLLLALLPSAWSQTGSPANDIYDRGVTKLKNNQYQEAIKDFTQAIQLSSGFWPYTEALYQRSRSYHELRQYDAEIDDLTEIMTHDDMRGTDPWMLFDRGVAYKEKGDYDNAIADLTNFILKKPDISEGYTQRADARHSKKQTGLAIQDFTQAIRLEPDDPVLLMNRADLELDMFDYKAALRDLNKALLLTGKKSDEDPPDEEQLKIRAEAYAYRALANTGNGDLERAMRDCRSALRLDPKSADAFAVRAVVKKKMGDDIGADADLAKAKQLDPKTYPASATLDVIARRF